MSTDKRRLALRVFAASLLFIFAPMNYAQDSGVVGFLTSSAELYDIATDARNGVAPHSENVASVIAIASEDWPYDRNEKPFGHGVRYGQTVEGNAKRCHRLNDPSKERVLFRAGHLIYSKVMAYYFTGDTSYAKKARDIITEFTQADGFRYVNGVATYDGSNQCILDLSWITPLLIESAILLEDYSGWTDWHRNKLQAWLAEEVYPLVAAISRTRRNNWGNASSFAGWAIGHYLDKVREDDDPVLVLDEYYPNEQQFSPRQAGWRHRNMQVKRVKRVWRGDSQCSYAGIQEHGGIPDELRRGSTGCYGHFLLTDDDGSYEYQQVAIATLVHHAEALKRHDRDQLYQITLNNGEPALLQGIMFVIDNLAMDDPQMWKWTDWRIGTLRVASRTFQSETLCDAIDAAEKNFIGDLLKPFTSVTHSDVCE